MGLTVDITLDGGVIVEDAYLRIDVRGVPTLRTITDDGLVKARAIDYSVDALTDKGTADAGGQRISYNVPGLSRPMNGDGMAVYDPEVEADVYAAAYDHLKTLDAMDGAVGA